MVEIEEQFVLPKCRVLLINLQNFHLCKKSQNSLPNVIRFRHGDLTKSYTYYVQRKAAFTIVYNILGVFQNLSTSAAEVLENDRLDWLKIILLRIS